MTTYHRVELHKLIYYIPDSIFEAFDLSDKRPLTCVSLSDFVVDPASNQLIKCRFPIGMAMDEWLGVTPK